MKLREWGKSVKRLIKKLYFYIKYCGAVRFGRNVNIGFSSSFEGKNAIGSNTVFDGELGYASYLGDNTHISGKVGRYCSIGDNVHVIQGCHPTHIFVSTHPAFYSLLRQAGFTYVKKNYFEENKVIDERWDIVVGNDVWIGSHVNILSGITIHDGAVIAAGAMVVKDVEPYSIVGGVPAREIGKRFNEEQIKKLAKIRWWEKGDKWLSEHTFEMQKIERLIDWFEDNNI